MPRLIRAQASSFICYHLLICGGKTKIKVLCRRDYICYTLVSWLYEVSEVLSSEFEERVEVVEEYSDSVALPEVYVDGELAVVGLPSEEGYLIESLKHAVVTLRKVKQL
ncbi:MAG: hypothetical protein QXZ22_04160 [Sulfolobales archaeon]